MVNYDLTYLVVRINPRLKNELIKELQKFKDLIYPVIIEEELYPDCLAITKQDLDKVIKVLDVAFFNPMTMRSVYEPKVVGQFSLQEYVNYVKGNKKKEIEVGSRVVLILDGQIYTVASLDEEKKQVVIMNEKNSILMRVPLETIKLVEQN